MLTPFYLHELNWLRAASSQPFDLICENGHGVFLAGLPGWAPQRAEDQRLPGSWLLKEITRS
jgi:hypothetical protein